MTSNLKPIKYYLETTLKNYYDGHGVDSEGNRSFRLILSTDLDETDQFIVDNFLNEWVFVDEYEKFTDKAKERKLLIEENQIIFRCNDFNSEDRDLFEKDGYHCIDYNYRIKEITIEQFENFFDTIRSYDELLEFSYQ